MKSPGLQKDKKIDNSIIKDVRNLFRLKRNRRHCNEKYIKSFQVEKRK